jgi:hypothetical protein
VSNPKQSIVGCRVRLPDVQNRRPGVIFLAQGASLPLASLGFER